VFEPSPLTAKTDPRIFLTAESSWDLGYEQSAHFVRWLLEERGPEVFYQAYVTSPTSGGDKVTEVLADVYGQDIDDLVSEYLASAPHMWVPHRQCADVRRLEPNAGIWQFDSTFDCDDPSTYGPWERLSDEYWPDADTTMYQSFLIEVATPGTYRFSREIETGVWVERCLDEAGLTEQQAEALWLKTGLVPTLQGDSDIELAPGTYRIDVLRAFAPPHPVSLRIEPFSG